MKSGKKKKGKKLSAEGFEPKGIRKVFSERPGLAVAAAISAVVIVLFIALLISNPLASREELAYAGAVFEENQATISDYLTQIDEELKTDYTNTLDDDYLYSLKADLEWLKQKEISAHSSPQKKEVYLKEIAFSALLEMIMQVNQNIAIDIGNPDYDSIISLALSTDTNSIELFLAEDFNDSINPKEYAIKTNEILNQLLKEYVAEKKVLIGSDASIERRYVEAKKIIQIGYINFDYSEYSEFE
ncbi:MAG: hypothetical protein NTZ73_01615 [Candidatus Diapherotrites archaeon]|nr:hypothetical protein [Candidatus Diapherotrites archaeon]